MKILIIFVLCFALISGVAVNRILETNNDRIIGGQDATTKTYFPYHVGIKVSSLNGKSFWCEGSLINPEWVLTAALCTSSAKSVEVFLATPDRHNATVKRSAGLQNIITHPDYAPGVSGKNDISLIRIDAVEINDQIIPVELPEQQDDSYASFNDELAIVTGWDYCHSGNNHLPCILQYAEVYILSGNDCHDLYPTSLCVGGYYGSSIYEGDTGSPVVLATNNIQVGIVSYIGKSYDIGKPTAVTRVSSFIDWIRESTGKHI